MKQQPFGTYLSARQRKLHKEIFEILVSLHRPETFEFIGDFEDIIMQQEQSTAEEEHSTAEEEHSTAEEVLIKEIKKSLRKITNTF